MADQPRIVIPDLCNTHQVLLVQQANYSRADPWRALLISANVALFQGATCDQKVREETGGDLEKIGTLGCLACRKPDLFGEVIEAAKSHNLYDIKTLGEKWIAAARKDGPAPAEGT